MGALPAFVADMPSAAASRAHDGEGEPLEQTLAICCRLAGASAASLLAVDGASGAIRVTEGQDVQPVDIAPAAVAAAIGRESKLMFSAGEPHWIPAARGPGTTVIARAASRDGLTWLLALSFADAVPITRARVVPELVALVAAQLAAEHRLTALEDRHAACAAALDHGDCGVVAVRDDHSVLFTNAAAAAMLADGDGLAVKRGLIRPSDYREAVRFEAALDAVQDAHGREHGGKALVMLLPRKPGQRPLISVVVPARAEPAARGASALIYLFLPEAHSARGLDTVAELHGLSRVEARLLTQLCAGLTVAESAERMRIKLETARAYLKQIFAKTGTHRQTELVTLMTRYLRAIRGDFDFRAA